MTCPKCGRELKPEVGTASFDETGWYHPVTVSCPCGHKDLVENAPVTPARDPLDHPFDHV